jgi:hypothetical protein
MSGPPNVSHLTGEATPQESRETQPHFGLHDRNWTNDQWRDLLNTLVASGMAEWRDIGALVLGHLNPSQVGTSLASSPGFKRRYGKGNTMRIVLDWAYQQTGRCADCNTRLELQADHIKGREQFPDDPLEADYIENMTLRCRRCNVVRRPSHELGGLTYLTAEAALMWILLVLRPRTFRDFVRMCRIYGMTMSDIRMAESWAMAHWLAKAEPPAFGIEEDAANFYDLIRWPDNAITRTDHGGDHAGGEIIASRVRGDSVLGFIACGEDGRFRFYEQSVAFIPFSTYDLGDRPKEALAISYTPPNRKEHLPQRLSPLPPRAMRLHSFAVRGQSQRLRLNFGEGESYDLPTSRPAGKVLPFNELGQDAEWVLADTDEPQRPDEEAIVSDANGEE